MKKLNLKVIRNLKAHKGQYIAIVLLIAIGIAIFLSFQLAVNNLSVTVDKFYEDQVLADLYVQGNGVEGLASQLDRLAGVEAYEFRSVHEGTAVFANDEDTATLKLISHTAKINQVYVVDGSQDLVLNEILLYKRFADARGLTVGDNIAVRLAGEVHQLKVKGIVYNPEFIYLAESERDLIPKPREYGIGYLAPELMARAYGDGAVNQLIIRTDQAVSQDHIIDQLGTLLAKEQIYPGLISSKEDQFSYRLAAEEIRGELALANSMPVLFLLIAALVMFVLIKRMVANERIEIGNMKALGYLNKEIMYSYIMATLLVGALGALLGIGLGIFFSYQYMQIYTAFYELPVLTYSPMWEYFIYTLVAALILSALAGYLGARPILKLHPQEAMLPETPAEAKRLFFEESKFYQNLKYTNKLVIRNIARNKRRFILTIVGIATAFAMLLTPFVYYDLFERMFAKQYTEVQVMDYDVTLTRPVTKDELTDLTKQIRGYAEGYLAVPVTVQTDAEGPVLSVLGIERETEVYNLKNIRGKPIQLVDGAFYLSEGYAMSNRIAAGDKISIQLYNTDQVVTLTVTELVDQKLGSNGYMTKQTLYDTFTFSAISPLGTTELYNGLYIQGEFNQAEMEKTGLVAAVFSAQAIIEAYQAYTSLIYASLFTLLLFGGLIAFIIIYQVSLMNINERRIEFASLRLLGLKNKELYAIVFNENLLASVIGIILGIPLGIAMVDYLASAFSNDLYSLSVSYNLQVFILATVATLVFIAISQFATRNKLRKLDLLAAVKTRIS